MSPMVLDIVWGTLGFVAGFLFKFALGELSEEASDNLFAIFILLVWMASLAGDMILLSYSTPWQLHAVMGTVVGAKFGGDALLGNFITIGRGENE